MHAPAAPTADERRRQRIQRQAERLLIDPKPGWMLNYAAMAGLSAVIAALGMRLDSAPIVIGAMLVAPVMQPVLGLGFACLTWVPRRSLVRLVVVLLATSVGLVAAGWLFTFVVPSTEVQLADEVRSRTAPDLRDLLVALAAGAVGAFALMRPRVADTIPGVAIAVALVPPPVAAGIALGESFGTQAVGAVLLYVTNLVAIVVGTVLTVLLLRLYGDRPFGVDTSRLIRATVLLGLALLALGIPLSGAFFSAVDDAQLARDEETQAVNQRQLEDAARNEIEAWIGEGAQPNLGIVSVEVPEAADDGLTTVSVVLLGDLEGYIPALDDLEANVADATGRDTVLSVRLMAVADQVSSRFEVARAPDADAEAERRAEFRLALAEWTEPLTAVRIDDVTIRASGTLAARIATNEELPPVAELNALLRERLGDAPEYELAVADLILGPTEMLAPVPTEVVVVVVDDRPLDDVEACELDDGTFELVGADGLTVLVDPDEPSITLRGDGVAGDESNGSGADDDGDAQDEDTDSEGTRDDASVAVTSDDAVRIDIDDGYVVSADFERDVLGVSNVVVTVTGDKPPC